MGIVHHGTHLQYFEAGRIEYLRRRGLDYVSFVERGVHLPVVETHVRYRAPIRFDELVVIETRLTELGRVKVRFDYRLLRDAGDHEILLADGYTVLACVDAQRELRRLPEETGEVLLRPETHPRAPELA
jgi:acyl-CoA thioester hydrolase